jgi:hypothetical protein
MGKRERGIHRLGRLGPRDIEKLDDGLHADGNRLYLQIRNGGTARSWLFRTRDNWMGLGSANFMTAADARQRAEELMRQLKQGIDPIEARTAAEQNQKLAEAKNITFRQVAEEYLGKKKVQAKTVEAAKHRLETFAYPVFDDGNMPIQKFDMRDPDSSAVDLVSKALEPLWKEKKEGGKAPTGELLRQDIYGVLRRAWAKRYIAGDNAASGDKESPLMILLGGPIKDFHKVSSHKALLFKDIGAFMVKLRKHEDNTGSVVGGFRGTDQAPARCQVCSSPHREEIEAARRTGASLDNLADRFGINRNSIWRHDKDHLGIANVNTIRRPTSAYGIEFLALTAVRKEQILGMRWEEWKRHEKLWVCPKERTKTKQRDHKIPLSKPALAVLERMEELQRVNGIQSEYVFAGGRGGRSNRPMSKTTLNKFLHESLGYPKLTLHGFRTSFKSWAKQTYPEKSVAAEACLDHAVPDLDKIYARDADLTDHCRFLLDGWAAECDRPAPLPAGVSHISEAREKKRAG